MKLSKAQQNVLEAITDQTNKRDGSLKRRIDCECYDQRTINSLAARGLIDYDHGTDGEGWAAK
jgi:hypothetical protein